MKTIVIGMVFALTLAGGAWAMMDNGSAAVALGTSDVNEDAGHAETAPRTEEHEGTYSVFLGVSAPVPMSPGCIPDRCWMGWTFFSERGLLFPVDAGAERIDVTASWTPTTPFTERLSVLLVERNTEWEGCDSPDAWCGEVVASAEGSEEVTLTLDAPEGSEYWVSVKPAGPVRVEVDEEVNLKALVHYSG